MRVRLSSFEGVQFGCVQSGEAIHPLPARTITARKSRSYESTLALSRRKSTARLAGVARRMRTANAIFADGGSCPRHARHVAWQ
jgi:uncharacterized protein YbjQ (UPF0145 family)